MSERKINLEEILINFRIAGNTNTLKLAMLEFGKQLLELSAENAKTTWNSNFHTIVDKQSILDTIKQVE